jgi:Family of unknown function (DUF5677)
MATLSLMEPVDELDNLRALIDRQLQLLTLSIFIVDKGHAIFNEHELKCSLQDSVRRVVVAMALAGGQSITTLLEMSKKRGIPVRDCYPIARSTVETLINATYVLSGGASMAERAMRHAQQKSFRDLARTVGRGAYTMRIEAVGAPSADGNEELKKALAEFTSAQGREKNWIDDSVPVRIESIGNKLGPKVASGLLGAYALIYQDASEIIHGSLFGIYRFYHGRSKPPETVEEFRALTGSHLEGILFAAFLSVRGYLYAFCNLQGFAVLVDLVDKQFDEFMKIVRAPKKNEA